ncbi:MAG: tetratricopeptide repeat protein [Elusimicrobiota bacterium]
MKRITLVGLSSIFVILSFLGNLCAKTFLREYSYRASEADSKITARSIALNHVKTLLLEEIGVYIESNFEDTAKESKSGIEQLTKQQIVSITAGVTETKILEEKWDGLTYYIKAEIKVDIDDVSKKVREISKDRNKAKELEEVKKKADEAFKQIELLQAQLAKTEDEKEKFKLQAEYQKRSDELSAADWFQMGSNAAKLKEYDTAILYFQKALHINPKDAGVYMVMGLAYDDKGNYDKAIELYEKAIRINPEHVDAYYTMGQAYAKKGNVEMTISCFKQAARLGDQDSQKYLSSLGIDW